MYTMHLFSIPLWCNFNHIYWRCFWSCPLSPLELEFGRQKRTETQRDAQQFRRFIWRAMKEMEHDKELRRKGGVCASEKLSPSIKHEISKSLSKLDLMTLHLSVAF